MKRALILLLISIFTYPALAKYEWEIEKAERSCENQKFSQLRERNGTPACDRLNQLIRMEREHYRIESIRNERREEREWQERQNEKYIKANPKNIRNSGGAGYRWNPNEGRYCEHNYYSIPTHCY